MGKPLVYYELEGDIARVLLNHPPLNALDMPTRLALEEVFTELEERCDQIRAVVLAGAGERAFAAGADIAAFLELTPETARQRLRRTHAIFRRVEDFPRPVIAAIHGYCLGGGLELALCCDVRYASEDAVLGFPEVGLSVFPGNGGTARGLRLLTLGRFKELVFSGRRISARQAYEYGLVERVVPPGQVMEAALELARTIARQGPLGVAAAKQVINRNCDLALEAALEVETEAWARLMDSHDAKEGARAFLEKRKPVWQGR
jgi:enoyl-CoA hydratase/carnithine racemase